MTYPRLQSYCIKNQDWTEDMSDPRAPVCPSVPPYLEPGLRLFMVM
jgi:hypothetical protein